MLEMFLISQRFLLSFMQLNVAAVFVCLSVTVPVYLCACVRAAHKLENIEIAIQPRNGFLQRQRRGDV